MAKAQADRTRAITDRVVVELKGDQALTTETRSLATKASAIVVDSIEAARAAKVFLQGVIALRRKIEAHYVEIKRPVNDLRTKILDLERRDLDPVRRIEQDINARITDYEAGEERRRREAARAEEDRQRREEEARRAREAQALLDQAKATRNRVDKAALKDQAQAIIEAPPSEIAVASTPVKADAKVEGMIGRVTWTGEVVDLLAFVQAVAAGRAPFVVPGGATLEINRGWLQRAATANGPELGALYPGLKAVRHVSYVSKER